MCRQHYLTIRGTDSARERVTPRRGGDSYDDSYVPPEWAGHLTGAGFALRCWLCSASADVVMRRVCGALLVAMLVVCRVCAESGRV